MAVERVDTAALVSRLIQGYRQADIADTLGVTQTAVSYWANGKRTPGLDDIANLLDATGHTWADVFGADVNPDAYQAGLRAGLREARDVLDTLVHRESPRPQWDHERIDRDIAHTVTSAQREA